MHAVGYTKELAMFSRETDGACAVCGSKNPMRANMGADVGERSAQCPWRWAALAGCSMAGGRQQRPCRPDSGSRGRHREARGTGTWGAARGRWDQTFRTRTSNICLDDSLRWWGAHPRNSTVTCWGCCRGRGKRGRGGPIGAQGFFLFFW